MWIEPGSARQEDREKKIPLGPKLGNRKIKLGGLISRPPHLKLNLPR